MNWTTLYKVASAIIVGAVIVAMVCIFIPKIQKHHELQDRKTAATEGQQKLKEEIRDLRVKQDRFASDPVFVERTARENNYVKPDEVVFKFTNDPPSSRTTP